MFDTDLGFDDVLALTYLCARTDVILEAVVVSPGLSHPTSGWRTARGILDRLGRAQVPAFVGAESTLPGGNEFPSAWREETEALGEDLGLMAHDAPVRLTAADVKHWTRGSTVLVCGAATSFVTHYGANLGPSRVVLMGGALSRDGNLHHPGAGRTHSTAEWNFHLDPIATASAIEMHPNVTIVTLDVADQVPITSRAVGLLRNRSLSPAGRLALAVLTHPAAMRGLDTYFRFWDLLAAVVAADGIPYDSASRRLKVIIAGDDEFDAGTIRPAEDGHPVTVVLGIDPERFERHVLEVWSRGGI